MNVAVVLPPVLLGRAINVALEVEQHRATAVQVGWAAAAFVGVTALTEGPRIAKRYWLGMARARFRAVVRYDVLRGVLVLPTRDAASYPVGDLMARAVGDVEVLGVGFGELTTETWDTLLFAAAIVVTMFVYSATLAVVALAPVPVALWIARRSGRMVAARTKAAREADSELTAALRELIGGLRLLRLTGRIEVATAQVDTLAGHQSQSELEAIRLDEALGAAYGLLLSSGVAFVVWLGAERVVAGSLSVGSLVAFLALFNRFVARAPRIPQMVNRIQAAGAAYRRLKPLMAPALSTKGQPRWASLRSTHVPDERYDAGDIKAPALNGPENDELSGSGGATVRFANATFTYPGSTGPSLLDVNLEVEPGTLVAVTGPIGSGKSAVARLAAGIFEPDSGVVEVGGVPPSQLQADVRARTVGYLGQDPHVFSGTVADNVTMRFEKPDTPDTGDAPDTSDAGPLSPAVKAAIAVAHLEADLTAMPCGANTQIGELGVKVSGGQRQRIALARAIAASGRAPQLLVLDDPFSSVDVRTEASIVAALHETFGRRVPEKQRATIILCSHRLAAFSRADIVVVLEGGRVVERGTHAELLDAGGAYSRIVAAQACVEGLEAWS